MDISSILTIDPSYAEVLPHSLVPLPQVPQTGVSPERSGQGDVIWCWIWRRFILMSAVVYCSQSSWNNRNSSWVIHACWWSNWNNEMEKRRELLTSVTYWQLVLATHLTGWNVIWLRFIRSWFLYNCRLQTTYELKFVFVDAVFLSHSNKLLSLKTIFNR